MSLIHQYTEELDNLFQGLDGKDATTFDQERVENAIDEGTELLDQLKIEVHNISNLTEKKAVQAKMLHYKDLIGKLQKQLLTNGQSRSSTMAASSNHVQRAEEGRDILRQARQQLADTEETAVDTMEHLTRQREQIAKATENTKKVNNDLGYSNKLLGKMSQWWRG